MFTNKRKLLFCYVYVKNSYISKKYFSFVIGSTCMNQTSTTLPKILLRIELSWNALNKLKI